MTDANKTDITLVLDQSPSMTAIWDATIEGVNRLIKDQQAQPGDADFTLVKFEEQVHEGYTSPLKDAPLLSRESYRPQGMGTALYDAIGHAIDVTGRRLKNKVESQRPGKVIFVIYTDGQENSSKRFVRETIKRMIEHQQTTYGWDFIFLGAELNAYAIGMSMGIYNSLNTVRAVGATAMAYASTSHLLSAKRLAANAFDAQNIGYSHADISAQASQGAVAQPVPTTSNDKKTA